MIRKIIKIDEEKCNGGGEKGYLCVEPQSGKVNGLNYADGYNLLRKGEKITFVTNIGKQSSSGTRSKKKILGLMAHADSTSSAPTVR